MNIKPFIVKLSVLIIMVAIGFFGTETRETKAATCTITGTVYDTGEHYLNHVAIVNGNQINFSTPGYDFGSLTFTNCGTLSGTVNDAYLMDHVQGNGNKLDFYGSDSYSGTPYYKGSITFSLPPQVSISGSGFLYLEESVWLIGNSNKIDFYGYYNQQYLSSITFTLASCTGPVSISWTDPTITANVTKIRKVHIDELRSWIDSRRTDAGLSAYSWTDSTITANSTKIRKVHFDEMRTAISQVYTQCGQSAPTWTDPTLTANSTKIRKVHIDELRSFTASAP